ncbi:MAG: hypothetical protein EOO34_00460 [Cyanobacteriota bacterium]|nr:MAG: hypothetical protein EOO34_00460 [Cyanobacteriota bacterium]
MISLTSLLVDVFTSPSKHYLLTSYKLKIASHVISAYQTLTLWGRGPKETPFGLFQACSVNKKVKKEISAVREILRFF